MDASAYKRFYDRIGKINGWDFSKVNCISEGVKWNFFDEVSKSCRKSDVLLDIGTGGGEILLTIADAASLLVGIDQSAAMSQTAAHNLHKSNKTNVRFLLMEAEQLTFPDEFFNVVSCRHSGFYAAEVARVLVKDGLFLTQQVSENDKLNLKQTFGRGREIDHPDGDGTLKNRCISELSEAGFSDIRSFDFDATEYYQSYEDLIFLLKHAPIIPDFGQTEDDFKLLQKFIQQYQTDKGIMTNAKRFMIIARK